MLYSKNGNYPDTLPFRIRMPDGRTRTDQTTFTEEELSEAGYTAVSDPPSITSLQALEWDSENIQWIVRDKSQQEIENELNSAKNSRMQYITNNRDSTLKMLTCEWNNDHWDARETDSTRIANVLTMIEQAGNLGIPTPSTVDWRTYDDQNRTLSIPELTQLGASMFQAQQIVWNKQATLKDQVQAATTIEEVNSIVW
jgi:hypothetical protein